MYIRGTCILYSIAVPNMELIYLKIVTVNRFLKNLHYHIYLITSKYGGNLSRVITVGNFLFRFVWNSHNLQTILWWLILLNRKWRSLLIFEFGNFNFWPGCGLFNFFFLLDPYMLWHPFTGFLLEHLSRKCKLQRSPQLFLHKITMCIYQYLLPPIYIWLPI